jgi:BirA family biotin operon repressor/biotin-[acetyl-CoA-carboxylase] ligase
MELTESRLITLLAPRPVRYYPQAGSTNDLALAWLNEGALSGSVVIADEQVKGKGRLGRSWYTPPGTALIVSIILHPKVEQLPQITMLGALAIAEMLDSIGVRPVGIKWPNDVQVNERKVSGVLPEAVWDGTRLRGVVLGMGINVRINFSGTEFAEKAISIEPYLGRTLDRVELLRILLERVDYGSNRLGTNALWEGWRARLTTLGQPVALQSGEQFVRGTAESVDDEGALLVRDAAGTRHRILAGDIALGS